MYAKRVVGETWHLDRHRVPLSRAGELATEGVLFMILSAADPKRPRRAGCRRVAECCGFDSYVLARSEVDGVQFYMLDGFNDGKFAKWYSERDPFIGCCHEGENVEIPFDVAHTIFEGVTVPKLIWAAALEEFEQKMH